MKILPCLFVCLTLLTGSNPADGASESLEKQSLSPCVARAWKISWERFFHQGTNQFYDYLTSYEPGRGLAHLPTADEVSRQYPNPYGYGTGMEDSMISAGVMLSMMVDRHAVTGEEMLRERARSIFEGIRLAATVHGAPGFLARGVCPEDLRSTYINSSRDQYTHAVHGLRDYFHSPLSSAETREEIAGIVSGIADRMTRNVIPENDYDSLRADGARDPRGISRMWKVKGHEAARLDYDRVSSCGIFDLQAAYWKARRRGLLTEGILR